MAINSKDILIIIPARYKSKRFPGKPLVKINGIEMIQRTYNRSLLSKHDKKNILVATDSKKILNFCKKKNIKSVMTSGSCLTGTDRVAEIAAKTNYKYYINLQGDEPVFAVEDLNKIINLTKLNKYEIINGYSEIDDKIKFKDINIPKVIVSKKNFLVYMSRKPVPTFAFKNNNKAYRQICVYAYSRNALLHFKRKTKSPIESSEDIEILRFLDLGHNVKMVKLSNVSISVDRPEDIKKVEKYLKKISK